MRLPITAAMLMAAVFLNSATSASAQAAQMTPATSTMPVEAKRNQTLEDASGRVLGKIYEVNAARGVVTILAQMKVFSIPIATLTVDGARLKTTLTKAQIGL